jgi:hypothetical protein
MSRSIAKPSAAGGVALEDEIAGNAGGGNMLDGIRGVGRFLDALQSRLRHGQASRVPLRLLRLEHKENDLECDWIARPPDVWDADLPAHVSSRNESWQALDDALTIRQLIFSALPDVRSGILRAYRGRVRPNGLIIEGKVMPGEEPARVVSLTMRAKLNGFRFCIENGVLLPLLSD